MMTNHLPNLLGQRHWFQFWSLAVGPIVNEFSTRPIRLILERDKGIEPFPQPMLNNSMKTSICQQCSKLFNVTPGSYGKFCSLSCGTTFRNKIKLEKIKTKYKLDPVRCKCCQTEIDFEMIQSLLIGNSVSFYQEEEKLNASINHSECSYTLSTIRKRKLKKVLSTPNTPPTDPLQTISLDPISFKILNILFIDDQNKTISAKYGDFTLEDSMPYPHKVDFYARGAKSSAQLGIKIHRIKLNQPLEFPFNIPPNCPSIITNTDSQIQKPKPPQNGKR